MHGACMYVCCVYMCIMETGWERDRFNLLTQREPFAT